MASKPLTLVKGANQFAWDLQYPACEALDDLILWNGAPGAVTTSPGNYTAVIRVDKDSIEVPFTILPDPNYVCSQDDYEKQQAFLLQVQVKFNEVMKGIKDIRLAKQQMNDFVAKQDTACPAEIKKMADSLSEALTSIEEKLHQTKAKSGQDVLNFPIRLDDKISGVFGIASSGNMAPSKQSIAVYSELAGQADVELAKINVIIKDGIKAFNNLIIAKGLPVVVVK